ncbi:valine--tRNA ligase [Mycoplasmatota bacterium]|nr:valine--tRNA ligase [Mycoplasmatota bacterium]
MNKEMKPKYNHLEVEKDKYKFWLEGGFFKSGDKSKDPFTIVIPPPNVTGKLHLGHAWDTTLQDIIIRRKRMQGYDALWLPGMDHAGIATQAKVDARLKEQGISRYDLGREKFLEAAWNWKHEYAENIHNQWANLGLSLDYSKERFTLDKGLNDAVNEVFIKLYNEGLIYQGVRIINWDPEAKTALSNIEVEHKDVEGAFYHFKYPFVDETGYMQIATTRPETMFGDTALMVHPDDERWSKVVGKEVFIPGTNTKIPIILDDYVDMEFGTGVVKVTPAHDPNDYEVGLRHDLDMPLCMNDDGTMNELAGKYNGIDRFECRKQVVADLTELGLCPLVEKITHSVGHSERTGVMVEPRLSKQWFVKMESLAQGTLDFQQDSDRINIVPSRFEGTLNRWMEGIRDWCISRQLWWGHRIPAWYRNDEVKVQIDSPGEGWVQDEDVLDTWFSSALWPFSTLGWPNETEDIKRYYPTNVLVTGYDIIFFWVSRMIFQGLHFTKQKPFNDVLVHGLIRDSQGRKMSKSLGNGIDPMDLIEQYGCDSLRYYLTTNSTPGQDLRYNKEKLESSWNFINKLWNISRYVLMNVDSKKELNYSNLNTVDKWIISKLNETLEIIDSNYDKYEFGEVARALYSFTWDTFASWYVEMSKVSLNEEGETKSVLLYVLESVIKLLHPFMPHVTEEIYQMLPEGDKSISISTWPEESFMDSKAMKQVDNLTELIRSIRNVRNEKNVPLSKPIDLIIKANSNQTVTYLNDLRTYVDKFCNPNSLIIDTKVKIDSNVISIVLEDFTVYLPLAGLIDLEEEKIRLKKELKRLLGEIERGEKMLSNENFISKAPKAKIDSENDKLTSYKKQYQEVKDTLENINE